MTSIVLLVVFMTGVTIAVGALARYGLRADDWWSDRAVGERILYVAAFLAVAAIASKLLDRTYKSIPAIVLVTALFLAGANWIEAGIGNGRDGDATWRSVLTVGAILLGVLVFIAVGRRPALRPAAAGGPWRRYKAASVVGLALLAVVCGVARRDRGSATS